MLLSSTNKTQLGCGARSLMLNSGASAASSHEEKLFLSTTLASSVKRLSCADNSKDLDFRNESQPKSDTPAPDLFHTFPEGPPGSNLASCSTRTSLQAADTIKGKRPPGADATRPALWPQAHQGFVMGHAPFSVVFCCAIHCHECLYTSTPIPHRSVTPLQPCLCHTGRRSPAARCVRKTGLQESPHCPGFSSQA